MLITEIVCNMNLVEKDQKYIWHPFTQMKTSGPALPIVKGEGTLLIDESGKSYIDAISSWWVNLHGHSHPYIAKKVFEQMQKLEHVVLLDSPINPPLIYVRSFQNIYRTTKPNFSFQVMVLLQ